MQFDLIVEPAPPPAKPKGQPKYYQASLDGAVLVPHTVQPLLDGARALLKQGASPDAVITTRHKGAAHTSLRSTIGAAAKLTVSEPQRGKLKFARWSEFNAAAFSGTPNTARHG